MKVKIKHFILLIVVLLINATTWACPVCEKQQPKITQGFTHGAGPQSNWDWVIIGIMSLITVLVFVFSMKYIIWPGEKNKKHIKVSILNNENSERREE